MVSVDPPTPRSTPRSTAVSVPLLVPRPRPRSIDGGYAGGGVIRANGAVPESEVLRRRRGRLVGYPYPCQRCRCPG